MKEFNKILPRIEAIEAAALEVIPEGFELLLLQWDVGTRFYDPIDQNASEQGQEYQLG